MLSRKAELVGKSGIRKHHCELQKRRGGWKRESFPGEVIPEQKRCGFKLK